MAITKIKVSNFKSFKDLELELGNFNVIVGANASGKSNFTQIFKFIRDIVKEGLENAISLQGGEYLTYMGVPFPKTLSLSIESDFEPLRIGFYENDLEIIKFTKSTYDFALEFENNDFKIKDDKLNYNVNFIGLVETVKKQNISEVELGSGNVIFSNEKGNIRTNITKPKGVTITEKNVSPSLINITENKLLLQVSPFFFLSATQSIGDIGLYDFDPKKSKEAGTVSGKLELEGNGSNLSLVLRSICENEEKKRTFSNLLKDLLPFVDDLSTDKFSDKSLLFKLKEKYFSDTYFPASFISDGTVNVSALLTALYFEKKSVTIIEEPERNIHPSLISRIVDMMKDASKKKQIIITTHNPEIVKYAGLENLLLISRDKEGFSTISRPKDNERVKTFMKNELGLDELYVQNLLED